MKLIHEASEFRKAKLNSTRVITLGFLGAILIGALLLMLPIATVPGEETDFLTALFTATTSICVTGLVVVDTYAHWTFFGQLLILILVQIGGFGVITLYSMGMLALGKRFSLRTRLLIMDYYNLDSIEGLLSFMIRVVKGTLIAEGIGALLYCFCFIPRFGFFKGLWAAIFNAVSAFCNAGMDVMGPDSLIYYQKNIPVNVITMVLIVLGGLGYVVWFDMAAGLRSCREKGFGPRIFLRRLSEQTKLVLILTAVFLVSGTVLVALFEWNNPATIGNLDTGSKILASLFQSVTFRTAGFATVPQEGLTTPTVIAGCLYMLIGGSPVGTAGGIKTVTFFVVFLNIYSFIKDRDEMVVFGRSISPKLINKANAIVTFNVGLTLILVLALIYAEQVPAASAAYEMFSATGTVGLSRGLTSSLHTAGRILVMIGMYAGRIGPISMALFFSTARPDQNSIRHAKGHFIVG
ncbi:MAG: potassium transporter TrkH [Lachnospiraceae bacterium]|nr:potassium transporter TrkH [Lachnospiraceae bacterium]